MPLSKGDLLAKLEAAGVQFTLHEHAAVMTVEAQEQVLSKLQGTVIKNLFVKDKKNRLYIISAAPSTKVDLAVLSARLGTGKGGVRFAPEELMQEVLKVEPGSVTPFAVANPEAEKVVLFLDQKIQGLDTVFVHPLVNTASLALTPAALTAGLKAFGREPIFVDLEADPKIDRDNPPDLVKYTVAAEPKADGAGAAAPAADAAQPSKASAAPAQPSAAPGKDKAAAAGKAAGGKGSKAAPKAPEVSQYEQQAKLVDVEQRTEELLQMFCSALLGKSVAEATPGLDDYVLRRLKADVQSKLNSIKNVAYAMGHTAGKGEVVAFATRQFA